MSVRVVFVAYLAFIAVGLTYLLVIGLRQA